MAKYKTPIRAEIDTGQLDSLVKRLAEVDRKAARKGMKKGVNEVTKLVLKEAKLLVPVRSGQLKRSLGRFVKTSKDGRAVFGVVKPRAGVWMASVAPLAGRRVIRNGKMRVFVQKFRVLHNGQMINPVKYAHLVEYGRVEVRPTKKKVLSTGKGGVVFGTRVKAVAPHPFMRPAWEKYQSQATTIIKRFLMAELEAFWKKSRSQSRGR